MAELEEKKAATTPVKSKKTAATKEPVAAVSSYKEVVEYVDGIEKDVVEEFKQEFKCLPNTPLTVVVRCGDRRTATYQEIELPSIKKLLEKNRG